MNEPTHDSRARRGPSRNFSIRATLGLAIVLIASAAQAGPIRRPVAVMKALQPRSADPWGPYWRAALRYHWKDVRGPKGVTLLKLSADGTLPISPFVEYLQWRQGLNVKRFNSYHPGIARLLRHVRPRTIPPIAPTPIEPPDFEAVSPMTIRPPTVPEPSTLALAAVLLGAGTVARRKAARLATTG